MHDWMFDMVDRYDHDHESRIEFLLKFIPSSVIEEYLRSHGP